MLKKIILKLNIYILQLLRRDSSNAKIDFYREVGYQIGDRCRIFSDLTSAEPYLVLIGNNVTISTGCIFLTHDNSIIKVSEGKYTDLFGKIEIGNDCFIGANSIILPGVKLEDRTIVAAGSVVTKSVNKSGQIIGGNPAKVIGQCVHFLEKNSGKAFDCKGKNRKERRSTIEMNAHKLIKREFM